MKKRFLVFSLAALLLLSACSAQQKVAKSEEAYYGAGYEDYHVTDEGLAPVPEPESPAVYDQTSTQERLVIKTADMKVSVADPTEAMQAVTQMANQLGGYVVSSQADSSTNSSGGYRSSWISIRVPTQKLDAAMESIRQLSADGKDGVLSESVYGEDVTSDFVDSQSRLRNLEAAEEQLMTLMENTTDLEQTMAVFRELTRTREQIEVLQGHIKFLQESASMSMISVSFVAEASLKPIEIGGWKPQGTAREALQTLIDIFQQIVDFLIQFTIVCLPFLIPLGVGVFFLVRGLKRRKAKKQAELAQARAVNQFYQQPPSAPQQD